MSIEFFVSLLALTATQPRCSNNYLLRLSLLAISNSMYMNDSFPSVDNLALNKVGSDSNGFVEKQQFAFREILKGMLYAYSVTKNFKYKTSKVC